MCKCNCDCKCTLKGHPHAELMAQYAEDAKSTTEPWEMWQFLATDGKRWLDCGDRSPEWRTQTEYRRKPRTININGYEVPEPERVAPSKGVIFFFPQPSSNDNIGSYRWAGYDLDIRTLNRGLLHLNRGAAELHAKALISFTSKE